LRILFVGDIFGSPGRSVVRDHLADIVQQKQIDVVIANGENAAGGFGITPTLAEEFFAEGVDVITTGNHVWDRKELPAYLSNVAGNSLRLLRPANYPAVNPGSGVYCGVSRNGQLYAVINLQGRVFMAAIDCPFRKADELVAALPSDCRVVLVDMHAEATSEKQALGWYLDGRVTAVLGTHTHVPTADERILPGGTAFQTDVGMTGPYGGIIGCRREDVLSRFLKGVPNKLQPASDDVRLCATIIEANEKGRATSIERLQLRKND
jgi:metallophosphoesterase (TIGR00282 family)